MRILLDASAVPTQPVGAGVYTWALAQELATRTNLDVLALTRRGDIARWKGAGIQDVLDRVPPRRPARLVWEQLAAPRVTKDWGLDVWHGPHYTLPLRLEIPTVVTVHDTTFFDHPEWHERAKAEFFRRMIRAACKKADAIVAVSQFTADRLLDIVTPIAPIVIAHHGVDHKRFNAEPDEHDKVVLRELGIRSPFIAFAGTLEPRKNIPGLIHAFSRLAARRRDLQLVLVGNEGWGTTPIREAISNSGVVTRILRPGYVPDDALPAMYRNAAVVAYPSLVEGFGLPALEALACGAPLVTTTGSATEEVVGNAAMLVAPNDDEALGDALEQVLADESLRQRLQTLGPEQARSFTWAASADRHIEAYELAHRNAR